MIAGPPARIALAAGLATALLGAGPLAAQQEPAAEEEEGPGCEAVEEARPLIRQVARLPADSLSVQALDQTVMGKRLAEMGDADFAELGRLYPECAAADVDPDITVGKFVQQVRDAQALYKSTLDWLDKTLAEIQAMPPTRASMIELNVLYEEMERRAHSLTRGDLRRLAAAIDARLTLIQAQAPSRERRAFDERRGSP